jgi:hypothetical protein
MPLINIQGRMFPASKDTIHNYSSAPGITSQLSEAFHKSFIIQKKLDL